jgi:hypothetical protein
MTGQRPGLNASPSPTTTLRQLNQTPIGENLARLLKPTGIDLHGRLLLAVLLEWATQHLAANPAWAQAVDNAVGLAEAHEPAQLAENLSAPGLDRAETLEQAGRLMLRWVVDLIPPDTQPA